MNKTLTRWLASLFTLAMPALATAQENGFDLAVDDQSRQALFTTLFGGVTLGDFANSPLASSIMSFNSAVLFVAGVIAGYNILHMVVSTATHGAVLGRRNHLDSAWMPVRFVLGSACLIPVFSGFNMVQVIVLWLAMQGAGLANLVWGGFLDHAVPGAAYVPVQRNEQIYTAAKSLLTANACVVATNAVQDPTVVAAGGRRYNFGLSIETMDNGNVIYNYGDLDNPDGKSLCGSYSFDLITAPTLVNQPSGKFGNDLQTSMTAATKAIELEHLKQINLLNAKLQQMAEGVVLRQQKVQPAFNEAVTSYATEITQAANNAYSNNSSNEFTEALKKDGWLYAGAYYMKFVNMQNELNGTLNKSLAQKAPITSGGLPYQDVVSNATTAIDLELEKKAPAIEKYADQDIAGTSGDAGMGVMDAINHYLSDKMAGAGSFAIDKLFKPDTNPILGAINLGEVMTVTGYGLFALAAGGTLLAGFTSLVIPGIKEIVGAVIFLGFLLCALGVSLTVVLPMTPYVIWFATTMTWAVAVCQSLLGAPLWAVAHLFPDGDGVVGKAGQGYMLVLGLLLRPALMVLGMVFSMVIVYPFGYVLNSTFVPTFRMILDGHSVGVFGLIAMVAMYFSLLMILVRKSFSMIYHMPDTVLNWIGGGFAQFGQDSQEAQQAVNGSVGNASNKALGAAKAAIPVVGAGMVAASGLLKKGTGAGVRQIGGSGALAGIAPANPSGDAGNGPAGPSGGPRQGSGRASGQEGNAFAPAPAPKVWEAPASGTKTEGKETGNKPRRGLGEELPT